MTLEPGNRFGSYEVAESIGAGGMGEVYRAKDTELKRDVALKVLPPGFIAEADRLARFQREAEILASLNHPNIAQVYGLEKTDGQTAIVMELVEGPTLEDRITQGPLPPDEAMGIAMQVVAALEAAHAKGIVHRDLKPANVKVRDDGTVKVLDFGISKPIDTSESSGGSVVATPAVTQTGVILGTAAYMSPEQARGKFVDQRTDIWAFGCLLFEMLTGQPAFGGEDVMLTLARVLANDTNLDSIPGTISPAVRHTIRLCLEKDPRKRIHHIGDVRLALDGRFESELPGAGQAESVTLSRGRFLPAMAGAIGMAVVAAALWVFVLSDSSPTAEAEVVRFSIFIPPDQHNDDFVWVAASPDGQEILYADSVGGRLMRRPLDEEEARPIPGLSGNYPAIPSYSPDGSRVLFMARAQGQRDYLAHVGLDGGNPQTVINTLAPGQSWVWGSDNNIYFSTPINSPPSNRCIFQSLPASGSNDPEPLTEHDGRCAWPQMLPGQRFLLMSYYPPGDVPRLSAGLIAAYDIEAGTLESLFPGKQPLFVEPGFLVYLDTTRGLVARSFDPETLEYGENVTTLVDSVRQSASGVAVFDVSKSGLLVFGKGDGIQTTDAAARIRRTLAIVDSNGVIQQELGMPPGPYTNPSVSPNEQWLAIQTGPNDAAEILLYDLRGENEPVHLTTGGNQVEPSWSADGDWVVFASDREGPMSIYRQRADGIGGPQRLTTPPEGMEDRQPVYAPDGRLTFMRGSDTLDSDILVLDGDSGVEPLLDGPGDQHGVSFMGNLGALAYGERRRDDGFSAIVYLARYLEESVPVPVSRRESNAGYAIFSRDRSTLAIQYFNGDIEFVDLDTSFAPGNRREASARANSVTPGWGRMIESLSEGRWLVVLRANDTASTAPTDSDFELVVVTNLAKEIEDRLGISAD